METLHPLEDGKLGARRLDLRITLLPLVWALIVAGHHLVVASGVGRLVAEDFDVACIVGPGFGGRQLRLPR